MLKIIVNIHAAKRAYQEEQLMDFRELYYITMIADCQSITKAAQKLYISQPSLSHLVSKVENELGVKLFDRTAYPITQTYAGERYVDTARQILRLNDNMRREFSDISEGIAGRITIGMPTERVGYMLPRILPLFKLEYPGIEVVTLEGKSDVLMDSVIKGQSNFIILPSTLHNQEVESQLIYREELIYVAGEKLIDQSCCIPGCPDQIDISKVAGVPHVMLRKGHAIRNAADALFKQYHIVPEYVLETGSTITAYNLAMAGVGATIVPLRTIEMSNPMEGYRCYQIGPEPYTWDVKVFYRKDSYLDNAEQRFIEIAKELFDRKSCD